MSTLAAMYESLTAREQEVYHMLCLDISVSEISKQLGITEDKADEYIKRVYEKFNVINRWQLIEASAIPLWE